MSVLVVDDDQDQLSLRSMLLEHNGFEILGASDCAAALQLAAAHQPCCAVIDLRLPTEECGFRLIRDLKELDSKIRLIVLTGSNLERVHKQPEARLIDELMAKPAVSKVLIHRIKELTAVRSGD